MGTVRAAPAVRTPLGPARERPLLARSAGAATTTDARPFRPASCLHREAYANATSPVGQVGRAVQADDPEGVVQVLGARSFTGGLPLRLIGIARSLFPSFGS